MFFHNSIVWKDKGGVVARKFSDETGLLYQLRETSDWPLLEISGVFMHRADSPRRDAEAKAMAARPFGRVLDTCMGLGYTAILASRKPEVDFVVSVERDRNVLDIARSNPFSREVFSSGKIFPVLGDSFLLSASFPENSFDTIIHDPPRFSRAGELYSLEFYMRLARILSPRGKLFHYTGKPGERTGKNYRKGIKSRLSMAGFRCKWMEDALGFSCVLANK